MLNNTPVDRRIDNLHSCFDTGMRSEFVYEILDNQQVLEAEITQLEINN